MSYVIAYNRPWCKALPIILNKKSGKEFIGIDNQRDLNLSDLSKINPNTIFFPHWSYMIPKEIYETYKCIIFHMTDLPYGRGGSPLQNLIVRGHKNTMISAIKCVEEVDAGHVYIKKPLNLEGTAEEIFIRSNQIIEAMILEIINTNIKPKPQTGEVVKFTRRKPEDGNLINTKSLDEIYDYIRMLDAEGYPPAFVRIGDYKLKFSSAAREVDSVLANVEITRETRNE
jgi:methionyl-tRNA formyltransferase